MRPVVSNTPSAATESRADYGYFHAVQTRWNDQDPYGHMNNA